MIRKPAVAGQFYPEAREELKKLISAFGIEKPSHREKTIACILPHAGYIYSGKVAASVLASAEIGTTCVLIGPNHTGYGAPASIMRAGEWQTPLGNVKIDTEIADKITSNSGYLTEDETAHAYEHSVEVEVPLLQEFAGHEFSIVPIVLEGTNKDIRHDTALAIAKGILGSKKTITLIASSDMTHYEPQEEAEQKDREAINAILDLDEKKLEERVERLGISMCGVMPIVVVLIAAKMLGAKTARLVAYQTSGDVTGDYSSVVGYAGIVIT